MEIAITLSCCSALLAQDGLRQQVAAIAADAHGKVSVACSLPGTDLNCDLNPSSHPPMQSVFKAPLALTALHLVESGKLSLDQPIRFLPGDRILPHTYSPLQDEYPEARVDIPLRRLLEMAVSLSDNVAADIVLRTIGGPAVVERYMRECGIDGFRLEDGFNRGGEPFWAEVDPQWKTRLAPSPASAQLNGLNDEKWSSALSIGEDFLMIATLQVSRFFQAVGNGGVGCAPIARHTPIGKLDCMAPTRVVEEATARKIIAAALNTVQRGSARRIAGAMRDVGWTIGRKTGTGGRVGEPMDAQDGWFAGLIFDKEGKLPIT